MMIHSVQLLVLIVVFIFVLGFVCLHLFHSEDLTFTLHDTKTQTRPSGMSTVKKASIKILHEC